MDPALWESLRAEEGADSDRVLEAVIRFARPGSEIPGVRIVSRFGTIATCRIRACDVIPVRALSEVISVKAAVRLSAGFEPTATSPGLASLAWPGERATDVRRSPALGLTGAGVVVAAVDWGVDVDSAAFRWPDDPAAADAGHEAGATRLLSFWDQRDQAAGPRPDPYGYGTVHSREEIDRALQDPRPYERLGYHPAIADRSGRGSHGTRTLDIAAGNGEAGGPAGIAPDADLIFVHLADRNTGGLANFGDSVRLLEAVDFISRTAGAQPCVINISAGRICGPKDGTTLVERALDELLAATPGRFVVNSAGNYFGWRAHSCGTIAPGEARSLTFAVAPTDVTANELEIWYNGADEFTVRIDPPGYTGGRPVRLGERSDLLIEGRVIGRVYHREHDPNNGDNHIVVYLDPVGRAGNWTVTLEAQRVSSGRFHAWIERDDACPGCQARFTHDDSNPATTIGSIATSHLPLIVGAYDGHDPARPVAAFSSAGPGRDGRCLLPNLVAPGVDVLTARSAPVGASRNPRLLTRGNGTSFAAPHVTGAVALCFETAGDRLSAHEIRSLVLGSCDPVPDADPQCRLGHGYLNIPRLIADTQQALAAPAAAPDAKEPTMDNADSVVPLGVAPAVAYREYLYRPDGQLARWIGARFDVVARPGQRVDRALQPGDLLIEVVLGRMRGGRCVILEEPELEVMASRPRLPQGQLILRPLPRVEMSEPMSVEPASEAEDARLDHLIGQGRAKIPASGHGPADVITNEGSPFLTTELLDAQDTEATDVAAWMEDEKPNQEAEEGSPFLTTELLDAQDTEATDVAAWMEDEKPDQEAEAWQAGTTAEAGRAGQGPGVGQVTVGVAELLQLWDTAAALDQLTRDMVRQTHLQRGGLVEPTMTPALPEWELEGEDPVPMTLPPPRPDPKQEQCRQRWEKIYDRLPDAVQTTLGQGNYALAVGLAIHSGIRDANLLTNMVFFTWQGPRRGYCPLASTEKDYIVIWNDIMKTMVYPRLAVPSPPVPQAGGIVCVARKDRRLAGPAPDNPAVDLTGRYEHRTPAGIAPAFTFRLNQAGKHVEAVLTTVLLPKGKAGRRDSYRLHGDLQTDGSFLIFSRTQPDLRVLLRRDAQTGSVSLDTSALPGGKIDQLDLVTTTPTLMESTLNYLPASFALVKPHEWFPLTRIQTRHLIDSLAPAKIDPFLKQYFDTPAGDRSYEKAALRKAARPFDDYLKNVFDDEKVGIHYLDRPLARFYARTLLSESRWKGNLTRSHLDWIQIMLSMVGRGDYSKDFQGIQAHLGLHPDAGPTDPNAAQHTYKVTLKLTGVGLFAHGYKGSITFEKTNPPLWPTSAAWPQGKVTFGIWILGLSAAPDISVGDTIEGEATTSLPWQPPDIPGTVSMVQGGIGVPGVAANAGFLHVYGSEIYPPMAVLFSGVGFKIPTSVPKSRRDLIPLPDLGGSWGKVQARSLPDLDYTTSHIKTDHAIASKLTEDVHFCSDGAVLTEDARQALRIMCANELAALMSPTSRLAINGHTDREDKPERNLALSDMRARNTYQAIKDILGDKLAIPSDPSHTEVSGKGETEAERDGCPDNKPNPNYRRTDIILNGRLVLTLRAQ